MLGLLYGDITNARLLRSLGGQTFAFPRLTEGDTLFLGLRLCEQVENVLVEKTATVAAVRATISLVDEAPTTGTLQLFIGTGTPTAGENLTDALDFTATAGQIQTALNALTVVGTTYGAATVEVVDDTWILTFDGETAAVPVALRGNTLRPVSFGRVTAWQVNGVWKHRVRFQRAPVAFTDEVATRVPPPPVVTRVQAGSTVDDVAINEIQKLTIPPAFVGSFQIKRNGILSALLSRSSTVAAVYAALAPLADEDGEFSVVEGGTAGTAYVEFAGTMAGEPQDLLEIVVFDAPVGDPWIALPLQSAVLTEAFAAAETDTLTLPLEIVVDLVDEEDDEVTRSFVVHRGNVVIQERVTHDDLAAVVDTNYVRSPYGRDYRPFAASQLTTGNQAYLYVFGNGADIVFAPVHELHSDAVGVMIRENTTGGVQLAPGTDYAVTFDNDDSATITLLGAYAATPPALNALLAIFVDYNQTSAFDVHDHTIPQVEGLLAILSDYAARLASLEALAPGGVSLTRLATTVPPIERALPPVWRMLRSRLVVPAPASLAAFLAAPPAGLREGRLLPAVHATATEALPTPLPDPDATYRDKVYTTATAVDDFPGGGLRAGDFAACDGREWYRVRRESDAESTYYPVPFEVELFREIISEDEFPAKSVCEIAFGFEAAMMAPVRRLRDRESIAAHWQVIVEIGTINRDTTPGTPGSNLDSVTWAAPVIASRLELTPVPKPARFALRIARDAAGDITLEKTVYRSTTAGTAPDSANFAIRARLGRFEIDDQATDPKGLVLVRGLDVGLDGQQETGLGRVRIG